MAGIEISEEAAKFGNAASAKISLLQEPDELAQGVFALLDGTRSSMVRGENWLIEQSISQFSMWRDSFTTESASSEIVKGGTVCSICPPK